MSTIKLQFESGLPHQEAAIQAVVDLFDGQQRSHGEFTVTLPSADLALSHTGLGIGNRLTLLRDEVQANVGRIQLRHGLPATELPAGNELRDADFTIEMETGTGKTYVYLATIFKLYKDYGFTKFVIVVPSVAIKEGVFKTVQITREHFRERFAGVPFDCFLYDSSKLGQVRNFATSSTIQIMVATVGAINKSTNTIYGKGANEDTSGIPPIELIRDTRPVVIVDEPQSVDGGLDGKGKEALARMNPLCTLRYSATHVHHHNMVYRLDAVDAYEQELVKQIEVASATLEADHNRAYVRVVKVDARKLTATLELDVAAAGGKVSRREVQVQSGDDLEQTTGRPMYANVRVGEISNRKAGARVELRYPGGEVFLPVGETWGDVDPLQLHRMMIRRTIEEHLEKELVLRPRGIKVLSLFFIDHVAMYRTYAADGTLGKGPYATIFEEEYRRASKQDAYRTLFGTPDLTQEASAVHDGYFAMDRNRRWSEPDLNAEGQPKNQVGRDDAERAYNLILKDKERLLSLSEPLKFIFSHSALREGWDNPNVFQICALRDIRTERQRRQTLGRGLRLCVDASGARVHDRRVNTLTVVAMESYEDFAANLQREIEADTGVRFGVVLPSDFCALPVQETEGTVVPLGHAQSALLWQFLRDEEYIDPKGSVTDKLRKALKNGDLTLPREFHACQPAALAQLKKACGRLEVHDANDKRRSPVRRAILESAEFRALWDRIKHRTTYRVNFDEEALVRECVTSIRAAPPVHATRLHWEKATLRVQASGIDAKRTEVAEPVTLDEIALPLPDLLTELQERTQLTRRTLYRIVSDSGRLRDFKRNPQAFLSMLVDRIETQKSLLLWNGITYERLGDDVYYAQALLELEDKLPSYLKDSVASQRSPYEWVPCDSDVERDFVTDLEAHKSVKVYAKLPNWFKIPTPLGTYNPDWAVLLDTSEGERLYFVVETKSVDDEDKLPVSQKAKIACGRAHFLALQAGGSTATYKLATKVTDLFA